MKRSSPPRAPLWRCSNCARRFANRNQNHFCNRRNRRDLERHFDGKSPGVRALFESLVVLLQSFGPVKVLPEKSRIAFQVRMSFAAVSVRQRYLVGHFVFSRRVEHPRFLRVETYSARNHLHAFRLDSLADLDTEFADWAREAYDVGRQMHLVRLKSAVR